MNRNVPLPDLARFTFFFFFFWIQEETTQESPSNIWTMRKVIFKTDEKREKIAVEPQLVGEERCSASARGLFMNYPYFYELQRMDCSPAIPPQCSILRLWRKKKKLKEDEFLSVLWIINLKNTAKSCRASCHDFSCRLTLSKRPTWTFWISTRFAVI